jgi:hypothetical protein
VTDTVAHTWQFAASVQNLLKQSIGTLDGTTVTGVKVFITGFHTAAGTGTVSVANADGVGTLTAPNQPYFAYSEIVAPNGYAAKKLWKFRVPNTVKAVSMNILVSSDFPAEQTVSAIAPDTEPMWYRADSNWNGGQAKRAITLGFRSGTSLADRQLAVAYVGGTLIGGVQADSGDGVYLISVASDGSASALEDAINRLSSLPQVEFATETARAAPYLSQDPRGAKLVAEQQREKPIVLALTCEMNRSLATVRCRPIAAPPAGASASVVYGPAVAYARFFPIKFVKDDVAHSWQFTAYLQNLLGQSVGTLNGTSVTGVRVFVTDVHASAGTGAVSVANADGTGNLTAPDQPYFHYNEIVAPNGYAASKLWKFDVPNTVTAVSMSVIISGDFPAEQNVTLAPPDTTAAWVEADSNTGGRSGRTAIGVAYQKRTVMVVFQRLATLTDRQLAVASVNGAVVGGQRATDGVSGWYLVQVPDDGTGEGVLAARAILRKQPQVKSALVTIYMSTGDHSPPEKLSGPRTVSPDTSSAASPRRLMH